MNYLELRLPRPDLHLGEPAGAYEHETFLMTFDAFATGTNASAGSRGRGPSPRSPNRQDQNLGLTRGNSLAQALRMPPCTGGLA